MNAVKDVWDENYTLAHLPPSSFARFAVRRLKNPVVVYTNREACSHGDEELVAAYARVIDDHRNTAEILEDTRWFEADRYGGSGHGGGARCGHDREFQVKGIGCNPLANSKMPEQYLTGTMNLRDAIVESAMHRVFGYALPHGVAQVVAIIATGSTCDWMPADSPGLVAARALLVREPTLRPAHFIRAPEFNPPADLVADHERCERAVQEFFAMRQPAAGNGKGSGAETTVSGKAALAGVQETLLTFTRKAADQAAAAKVKRLVHGSMSSSNICLDGRWIDLMTATAFPGWGTAYTHSSYWNDETQYHQIFDGLCFHVFKYLGLPRSSAAEFSAQCKAIYAPRLKEEVKLGFCGLAGFSMHDIRRSKRPDAVRALGSRIRTLSRQGYAYPESLEPEEHHKFGGAGMAAILQGLAAHQADDSRPRGSASSHTTGSDLSDHYAVVWADAFEQARARGVSRDGFAQLIELNAAKVGQPREYFIGSRLLSHVSSILEGFRDPIECVDEVSEFFSETESVAACLYADNEAVRSLLWLSGSEALYFDAARRQLAVGRRQATGAGPATLEPCSSSHPLAIRASAFWHPSVWRIANGARDIR
jgi:hypothetical protein